MNIKDLAASDFPGIDPAKFEEWKTLQIKANRVPPIGTAILFGVGVITVPLIGGAIGWGLPAIAYLAFTISQVVQLKNLRALNRELKMGERLKAKRKGLTFNE